MKDSKNIVIGLLCTILCVMAVAYAAFSTTLSITGTASVDSTWDISIASIDCVPTSGGSITVEKPEAVIPAGALTATIPVNFHQPGDKAVCTITVENNGTLTGYLTAITTKIGKDQTAAEGATENAEGTITNTENVDAIFYSLDSSANPVNTDIAKLDTTNGAGKHTFVLTVEYKDIKQNGQSVELTDAQKTRTLIVNFNYKQRLNNQ